MASSYLHRLAALEECFGVKQCDELCVKCFLAKLRAEQRGGVWDGGCDNRPINLEGVDELTDDELFEGSAVLNDWLAAQIGPPYPPAIPDSA